MALHDPDAQTKVSADASLYRLGVVLLQKVESEWKLTVYASRSMADAEHGYAQIEKEALAITWAREEFSDYILGKSISMETDHKPLVPVLGRKSLDSLSPRVLRFCLRQNIIRELFTCPCNGNSLLLNLGIAALSIRHRA